jgi:hypothetical protein
MEEGTTHHSYIAEWLFGHPSHFKNPVRYKPHKTGNPKDLNLLPLNPHIITMQNDATNAHNSRNPPQLLITNIIIFGFIRQCHDKVT